MSTGRTVPGSGIAALGSRPKQSGKDLRERILIPEGRPFDNVALTAV